MLFEKITQGISSRQCLNNFKDNTGVIQLIGAEFTRAIAFCTVLDRCDQRHGKKKQAKKRSLD